MDSQAPNQAALEWMREKEAKGLSLENVGIPTNVRREVTHGDSRFDLAFELKDGVTGKTVPAFMESKGSNSGKRRKCILPGCTYDPGSEAFKWTSPSKKGWL